jgi:hypothetical protein
MTPDPRQIESDMQVTHTAASAEALALSERTLERFRVSGVGPKFVRSERAKLIEASAVHVEE